MAGSSVRITASARDELLQLVASVRERDRAAAHALVGEIAERLEACRSESGAAAELGSTRVAASAVDGHRIYVRERGDTLWVLAVWPERLPIDRRGSADDHSSRADTYD